MLVAVIHCIMKLIFCKECCSVFSLSFDKKTCDCEKSWGQYERDGLNAKYGGEAIPLGFANNSFRTALNNQPKSGMGKDFSAFVIPAECSTFHNCN